MYILLPTFRIYLPLPAARSSNTFPPSSFLLRTLTCILYITSFFLHMANILIPYPELMGTFESILILHYKFSKSRASLCADLFAKASLDGVASHGANRFPVFLEMIRKGYVDATAEAVCMDSFGFFERWDGKLGPGNLNAHGCMDRAIELAKSNGVGMVALQNTNHWMRAGNYGWQAVDQGCIGVCFTNTKPNMPAWGGSEPKLGNNPLVVAIPRSKGPIVLDMAMSQFSYGKMSSYLREDKEMPFVAGFDSDGGVTKSPKAILEGEMALPAGLWKGAGLSLLLDMLSAYLSGGKSTYQIGENGEEFGVSQVFLCLYPPKLGLGEGREVILDDIIEDLLSSSVFPGKEVRYPGENVLKVRQENRENGVPVDQDIWNSILKELT